MLQKSFIPFVCAVLFVGFAFAQILKAPSLVGEKESSPITPSAPSGPVPRNAVEPNMNPPERGLPTGAEVYDVMEVKIDPKTGQKVLVPVVDDKHKKVKADSSKHAPENKKVDDKKEAASKEDKPK